MFEVELSLPVSSDICLICFKANSSMSTFVFPHGWCLCILRLESLVSKTFLRPSSLARLLFFKVFYGFYACFTCEFANVVKPRKYNPKNCKHVHTLLPN